MEIRKKIVILLIVFIVIIVGSLFILIRYFSIRNLVQQQNIELNHAQNSQEEVKSKPFITKLPIFTAQYSIYYSSVNNEIDIVFTKTNEDLQTLTNTYHDQIYSSLRAIGVDTQKEKIQWLLQQ